MTVEECIDYIAVCSDFNTEKPEPTVFIECMKRLGITDRSKCIIFEDSVAGLTAGQNAAMKTVICHMSNDHKV